MVAKLQTAGLMTGRSDRVVPRAVVLADGSQRMLSDSQAAQVELVLAEDEMLSPHEAAVLLGVSRPMVSRWISEGVLPDVPVGSHHQIPRAAVLAYKDERIEVSRSAVAAVRGSATDPSLARRTAVARAAAALRTAERDG